MDTTLVITISVIFASVLILLLFVVFYFLYKYFRLREREISNLEAQKLNNDSSTALGNIPEELVQEYRDASNRAKDNLIGYNCIDHPELQAVGRCAISDELYCELCLTKESDVKLARKLMDLWLDNEWETVFIVNNEEAGADQLNLMMKSKKEIWLEYEIPVVTQKQFKINIEEDRSESYTIVMAKKDDSDIVKEKFHFINK